MTLKPQNFFAIFFKVIIFISSDIMVENFLDKRGEV